MNYAALIAVVTLALASCPARAETKAGELLAQCEQLAGGWQIRSDGTVLLRQGDGFNEGQKCWSYMSAVHDLAYVTLMNPDGTQTRLLATMCLPNGVGLVQLIRVFLQYARSNPARLHESATSMILTAIYQSFPCER
jgi:hypothetical protein